MLRWRAEGRLYPYEIALKSGADVVVSSCRLADALRHAGRPADRFDDGGPDADKVWLLGVDDKLTLIEDHHVATWSSAISTLWWRVWGRRGGAMAAPTTRGARWSSMRRGRPQSAARLADRPRRANIRQQQRNSLPPTPRFYRRTGRSTPAIDAFLTRIVLWPSGISDGAYRPAASLREGRTTRGLRGCRRF
jgi:hypothetical protein